MPRRLPSSINELLLRAIEQAFNKRSWHGPNLRGSIRGVNSAQAALRPAPGRHSIAEQVLHAAYWKYVVRRKLTGEKRGSFALAGSNWFVVPDMLSEAEWKRIVRSLEFEHERLRDAVVEWIAGDGIDATGGKTGKIDLILGVAAHDVYHAGQISLLKRLHRADAHD
jgi:uncharacterized damage-inducible protein DinB